MPVKMTKRLSSITTERRGVPSSPSVAENFMNFQQNYSTQRAVRPSKWNGKGPWKTMNGTGDALNFDTGTAFDSHRMEAPAIKGGATKI
jgi:hypothetical protein